MKVGKFYLMSICLTTLCLVILAGGAFAGEADSAVSSPLLDSIRKNYNRETWLSTKFTLSIYWSVREKEEKKSGTILLAPGNRFRVSAGDETWVSNGETLWDWTVKANQVVIRPLAAVDRSMLPAQILSSYLASSKLQEKERKGGVALFAGKADSTAVYKSIDAWVGVTTGMLQKCVLTDRNDNRFTYSFSKTLFGKKNVKEAFEFAIPTGAHVIDRRN
jgi:outer membrane lipoprotein-sorting protein